MKRSVHLLLAAGLACAAASPLSTGTAAKPAGRAAAHASPQRDYADERLDSASTKPIN